MKKNLPWFMAFLTFIFLGSLMPGLNSSAVLFVVPVTEELNISRGLYSGSFFLLAIVQLIVSSFYGKLAQRLRVKQVVFITAILAISSCVVSALAQNTFLIYLGAALRGAAFGFGMVPVAANIISNWFYKYRGFMMGLVFSATGIGGLLLMHLFTSWVNSPDVGWRLSYYYIAVIVGVPMLLVVLFIKGSPEEAGTSPYGVVSSSEESLTPLANDGLTLKKASKTLAFYICISIIFLVCATIHGTFLHLGSFFADLKMDISILGIGLSLFSIGVAAGQMLYGFMNDKFGIGYIFITAAIFYTISIGILLLFKIKILIILAFTIFGLATGINIVSVGLLTSIFGKKYYSEIIGIFSAVMALGMAIGPYVLGLAYDYHNTYTYIFIVCICLVLIAGVLGLTLRTRAKVLERLIRLESYSKQQVGMN